VQRLSVTSASSKELFDKTLNPTLCLSALRALKKCHKCEKFKRYFEKINTPQAFRIKCTPKITRKAGKLLRDQRLLRRAHQGTLKALEIINDQLEEL